MDSRLPAVPASGALYAPRPAAGKQREVMTEQEDFLLAVGVLALPLLIGAVAEWAHKATQEEKQ